MNKWLIKAKKASVDSSSTESSAVLAINSRPSTSATAGACKHPSSSAVIPSPKRRKYDSSYIKYGFSSTLVAEEVRPICVICSDILANDSLRPVKLTRHLNTKHPEYKNKPVEFFQRHASQQLKQSEVLKRHAGVGLNEKLLKASFEVALLIAKNKKGHTIGESLVLPAAYKICQTIYGEKIATPIKSVPVSNDTVGRRIIALSLDVKTELLVRVKNSPLFAIQLDETIDVTNCAQLMVFVRYMHKAEIFEDYLFCTSLSGTTKGTDIFNAVNDFFIKNDIEWPKCSGVCTDGAAAMVGHKVGFIAEVRKVSINVKHNHCMLHREHLASQCAGKELSVVLKDIVNIVNFIKRSALNSRLFSLLCQEMGSHHDNLLYHTEVRWLSRGKVLTRVMELRDEVKLFLEGKKSELADRFVEEKWLCLAYFLADIFGRLNELNMSMQGKNTNMIMLSKKIKAFNNKIDVWTERLQNKNVEMFASLHDYVVENNISIQPEIITLISEHISQLRCLFDKYFPNLNSNAQIEWISLPFAADKDIAHIPIVAAEELSEIRADVTLEEEFKMKDITYFWCNRYQEFPQITKLALDALIPFASTYLCETAFSTLLLLKNKHRSRLSQLSLESNLRLSLSNIQPNIDLLCSNMQAHPSH